MSFIRSRMSLQQVCRQLEGVCVGGGGGGGQGLKRYLVTLLVCHVTLQLNSSAGTLHHTSWVVGMRMTWALRAAPVGPSNCWLRFLKVLTFYSESWKADRTREVLWYCGSILVQASVSERTMAVCLETFGWGSPTDNSVCPHQYRILTITTHS